MLAVLTVMIAAAGVIQVSADNAVSDFSDVKSGAWYSEAVEYVTKNNFMNGVSEEAFSPNTGITRGMIVTILHRLEKEPKAAASADFKDVAAGKYYVDAVSWALENDIAEGSGDGNFGPDDTITREQLAVIMYRYAAHCGKDTGIYGEAVENGNKEFADISIISPYAKDAAAWAAERGYIRGTNAGMFLPQSVATRAETAQIIMNFCGNTNK